MKFYRRLFLYNRNKLEKRIVYRENKDTISPNKYKNIICFDKDNFKELFVVSASVVSKSKT